MLKDNIFLTGFSGTGKTTVGREVARVLGWRFVDTDRDIAAAAGASVEALFSERGEKRFRRMERDLLASVCREERQVVSTGGGMPVDETNRRLMERSGLVVCLEARPETILGRLETQIDGPDLEVRPLLAGADPSESIVALKSQRQPSYSLAHWTVHTDGLIPLEAADEVHRAWRALSRGGRSKGPGETGDVAATVHTSSGSYPVWVGWEILTELGERVGDVLSPGAVYVVTDEGAYRPARRAQVSLEAAGLPSHMFIVPPGESSKSLEMAQHLYGWLAERRAERGHLVLAVGGGVVGDLAGFVAATFMRGLPFGQVPTTLIAMMDSAIGGKTGVDLPQGKNMVGAFHQPRFVLADVKSLESLPERETTSGWAEAVKHGLILDEGLFQTFEDEIGPILSLDRDAATAVIRRSVAIKADVVSRDERDTQGVRALLNYGHTIGHALEAVTGYTALRHGEAVSIGMMGAAYISSGLGMLSEEEVSRQRAVLESCGLPVSFGDLDAPKVLRAMALDKKTEDRMIRWVLLGSIGHAVTRTGVSEDLVQQVLTRLRG